MFEVDGRQYEMDEAFREIDTQAKIKTPLLEQNVYSSSQIIRLTGRYNRSTEKMDRLWSFLDARGWIKATHHNQISVSRTCLGWCHPITREVSVKPGLPLGNQLYTMIHEVAHTVDLDQMGYSAYMDTSVLGGFLGGEVRADTVAAMVMTEITQMGRVIDRAGDYIATHNKLRPWGQPHIFPDVYEDRIKKTADLILSIVS